MCAWALPYVVHSRSEICGVRNKPHGGGHDIQLPRTSRCRLLSVS